MPSGESYVFAESDPLWYKDAIIYQSHVRAFYDRNGDGIGDFAGLTEKLDYLQDLGITAIWLLPFYPSPLRDDGYDIADYSTVNPIYGTLGDFKTFLREAHNRGLRVITELVLNHTSDQHVWFQRARRAKPGTPERDFYVWSDAPDKYLDARIIFKDFEPSNWSYDNVAKAYYWHRFYAHQPDLNYDNPAVREAAFRILDYWFDMGVDGLRLDAVPYLIEREGTNCENLPETHDFLKELRARIDAKYENRMLLAEANQWPEDAIAYFGNGDECHTCFHFPLMPRLFMAIHMEDRFPIIDIMQQTPAIPNNCQWVLFLRNHDELTLEMVTDEERDYMYRVYARDPQARINLGIRRRLAPLLGNNRRKIELMNGLLISMPGTPVIYYGDEIGMGDNIYLGDRNGVRTPMQWSADRNAGFSKANPQKLFLPTIIDSEYHYESVNVETQRNNPGSLFWWTKRLLGIRQQYPAFSRGALEFLSPENPKVLAYIRCYEDQCILLVANLSRFSQYVELDLKAFEGRRPIELFGQTKFPLIGSLPYLLTLGPHGFYAFLLDRTPIEEGDGAPTAKELPKITVANRWEDVFHGRSKSSLERILRDSVRSRRWFGGKARAINNVTLFEAVPVETASDGRAMLALIRIDYTEGEPDSYVVPIAFAEGEHAARLATDPAQPSYARVATRESGVEGVIYDALWEPSFSQSLFNAVAGGRRLHGQAGELVGTPDNALAQLYSADSPLEPSLTRADQSNTSVVFGDKLILKLFRRVEGGINPDLEIGRFLTEVAQFAHTPPVAGSLEYSRDRDDPVTVGILQGFVPNEGTAWRYALDELGRYFERMLADPEKIKEKDLQPGKTLLDLASGDAPEVAKETISIFLQRAELLGQRTAEMHIALASGVDLPNFTPEPFTQLYQRSLYQSMRKLGIRTFQLLRKRLAQVPEHARASAEMLIEDEAEVLDRYKAVLASKIDAQRIRCHGDYHLGQVLYTGKDFVIIDFEGEPARSLSERRLKRSPVQDVAGMIRSLHYAASQGYFRQAQMGAFGPDELATQRVAAQLWYRWSSSAFLKAYLRTAADQAFLPKRRDQLQLLLDLLLLDKAVYELNYELNNRPDWIEVPLRGIVDLIGQESRSEKLTAK